MSIEEKILLSAAQGVKALWQAEPPQGALSLQKTRPEFEGQLTLVVFPLLRLSRQKPEQTAAQLGAWLGDHCPSVEKWNAVKGFLNLSVAPQEWLRLLCEVDAAPRYGLTQATEQSPLVMVEYSSPNTNKPLHLGHVRNNLLGWAVAQIAAACGQRVVKTNIVNDRGIHICKSMLAWQKWGQGRTPESTGQKGDHLVGDFYVLFSQRLSEQVAGLSAELQRQGLTADEAKERAEREAPLMQEARDMLVRWEQGDGQVRALWQQMNQWVYDGFDETYRALGVGFDKIYYESQTYLVGKQQVEQGLERGLFQRHEDGSVWADLRGDGLDEKLLLRADGTSVYMTQDIGTAKLRFEDYPIDRMVYVVGNEQNYHFQVLSLLLDRLGFSWGKSLVHYSYGMVELPNGKMKSREGTVVDADDLISEMTAQARATADAAGKFADMGEEEKQEVARKVGLGALKYFLLRVDARKNMLFNPEESIDFNGNTGPFIQYTYARIRSILRKAQEAGLPLPEPMELPEGPQAQELSAKLSAKEQELIAAVADFAAVVRQAGADYSPSVIANYCYELTKSYNQFYHDCPVLREADAELRLVRLVLSRTVAKVLRLGMGLLGIEMPERM